ncbi:hypothetical protein NQ117_00885 [Paenibacillus sp. SC116]|uniref:hypothetical protein n=1 Tax=Paenibacillus sp. SC116 TaxID=2968986 RepID=UPI00215AC3A3|nr:hypothetical protein [Paenibacillus sp. SC116]MCR8842228.1 hypothetical protein [Paenibacillus sp. SC116]
MKKITVIVFILSFILMACTDNGVTLTSDQVKATLADHGVVLPDKLSYKHSVFTERYNQILPEHYLIDEHQSISIYVYSSREAAKEGYEDFTNKTATMKLVPHSTFQVANVLIFYVAKEEYMDKRVKDAAEGLLVSK